MLKTGTKSITKKLRISCVTFFISQMILTKKIRYIQPNKISRSSKTSFSL